jgi:hypothetical protein
MSELGPWVEKLNGMTVRDIHALMVAEDVRGKECGAYTCVIAEFLRRKVDRIIAVGPNMSQDFTNSPRQTCFSHSDELNEFITAFDNGEYPELSTGEAFYDGE